MAVELEDFKSYETYTKTFKAARKIYLGLWNGTYYNYDTSQNLHQNSIQSDQMAGNWYSVACGLGGIVPFDHARSCLDVIYKNNVVGFSNIGVVNGVRPDGSADTTCIQSSEVWTGVTFAVISSMLQVGLQDEAFRTLQGFVEASYDKWGYIYDTPEAWTVDGKYRSKGYMRPLSIWAIQWELVYGKKFSADDNFTDKLEEDIAELVRKHEPSPDNSELSEIPLNESAEKPESLPSSSSSIEDT